MAFVISETYCTSELINLLHRLIYYVFIYFILSFAGKQKCMMKTGDCVIKHPGQYTTGLGMVVGCYRLHCSFMIVRYIT